MSAKADRSRQARLVVDRSLEERCLLGITRSIWLADRTDGVVVASGIRWLLVNRLSPDLDLDGYTAVRWKHVKKVQVYDRHSLPARAITKAPPTPVPATLADATTTGSLLRSVATSFAPVAMHRERTKPLSCTTGTITGIVAKAVRLAPAPPSDRPDQDIEVPFEHITRIDFGTRYLASLARAENWSER